MRAIQMSRFGGPEVLEVVGVPKPEAGPGQIVVRMADGFVLTIEISPPLR